MLSIYFNYNEYFFSLDRKSLKALIKEQKYMTLFVLLKYGLYWVVMNAVYKEIKESRRPVGYFNCSDKR